MGSARQGPEMALSLNTLWVGSSLGPLQRLCLLSALATGLTVRLFCDGRPDGVPDGVETCAVEEVNAGPRLHHVGSGSLALFSDRFRYAMIRQGFGAWFDTDLLFLRAPEVAGEFSVGWESTTLIASCFLHFQQDSSILNEIAETAAEDYPVPAFYPFWRRWKLLRSPRHISELDWGVIGPDLVTHVLRRRGRLHLARPQSWCCPVSTKDRYGIGRADFDWRARLKDDSFAVHLWNHALPPELRGSPPEPGSLLAWRARELGFKWDR